MLWQIDEWGLFVVALALFGAVLEVAFRIGRRSGSRADESVKVHVSALQAALSGLLALLLGFNFALAASRFDTRKGLLQDEVNAIRTTSLRAQLLAPPLRQKVHGLLRRYVASRIEFLRAGDDDARLEAANGVAAGIEEQLWPLAVAAAADGGSTVPPNLFIQSLNDLFNINEKRQSALVNRVPETVIAMLFFVALCSLGFISYGHGLRSNRRHVSTAIFAFLIALVLTLILDLDRPRRGLIRIGEDSMVRLRETLDRAAP